MCSCGSVRSEPARACASVYCTNPKSFVRCKPTKALYSVLVLAPQGFALRACVLVRSYEQMSSCTRTYTYVRYELPRSLCFCAGGCADELLYGNLYVCTVRAHNGFMHFSSTLVSQNEAFTWNQYACVSYAKTGSQEIFNHRYCLCTEFRNVPLPARSRESAYSWANGQGKSRYSIGANVRAGKTAGPARCACPPVRVCFVPLGYPRCRVLEPTNC